MQGQGGQQRLAENEQQAGFQESRDWRMGSIDSFRDQMRFAHDNDLLEQEQWGRMAEMHLGAHFNEQMARMQHGQQIEHDQAAFGQQSAMQDKQFGQEDYLQQQRLDQQTVETLAAFHHQQALQESQQKGLMARDELLQRHQDRLEELKMNRDEAWHKSELDNRLLQLDAEKQADAENMLDKQIARRAEGRHAQATPGGDGQDRQGVSGHYRHDRQPESYGGTEAAGIAALQRQIRDYNRMVAPGPADQRVPTMSEFFDKQTFIDPDTGQRLQRVTSKTGDKAGTDLQDQRQAGGGGRREAADNRTRGHFAGGSPKPARCPGK